MENEFDTNEMGLSTCISVGGVVIPIPPNATTTEENSQDPNHLKVQCITRKIPYFVMIAYYKSFDEDETRAFIAAAEFKKKRLQEQYPNAYIDEVKRVTTSDDFIKAWNEINTFLTGPLMQYDLREVHFFGHSSFKDLNFYLSEIKGNDVDVIPKLPWSKTLGASALVLHSCRSSRYEEQKGEALASKKCIANDLSKSQRVRVVGQVVYATNNTGDTVGEWKYRNSSLTNYWELDWFDINPNVVLWGYRAGLSVWWYYSSDNEYKNLSDSQIWPCRGFIAGKEHPRIVRADVFNDFDLTYI